MKALDQKYITVLDNIKSKIQLSEELKTYLDTEEDEDYKNMVAKFEGEIHELYTQVASENPLQLEGFEQHLLDEQFEGLYLPKAVGYAVLRGRVNDNVKYFRPQNHFAQILNFIINSSNFDQIKQRVGQSVQIGFALSSDIYITNLLDTVTNKRVKTFLETQKLHQYREPKLRNNGLVKLKKQFQSLNYATAQFPQDLNELLGEADSLADFLVFRGLSEHPNENLTDDLVQFVSNESFRESEAFFKLCIIIGLYYDLGAAGNAKLKEAISSFRKSEVFNPEEAFVFINDHSEKYNGISIEAEKKLSSHIDRSIEDDMSKYFNAIDEVLGKGYVHADAIGTVRDYYYQNKGLSFQNETVRQSILTKLSHFMANLPVEDYNEYFEINKTFTQYIDIFGNQKFNQDLKDISLKYVQKCLKNYKDKRSKEYQDIKKFVKTTFLDFRFMTEKQIVELFKTKRKPRKTT